MINFWSNKGSGKRLTKEEKELWKILTSSETSFRKKSKAIKKPGAVKKLIVHKDRSGNSLLHLAMKNGDWKLCQLLIKNGAELNVKNKNKKTPFDVANLKSLARIQKLNPELLNKSFDNEGNTLLHLAIKNAPVNFCKSLVENGANIYLLNDKKESPLTLAKKSKNKNKNKLIEIMTPQIITALKNKISVIQETLVAKESVEGMNLVVALASSSRITILIKLFEIWGSLKPERQKAKVIKATHTFFTPDEIEVTKARHTFFTPNEINVSLKEALTDLLKSELDVKGNKNLEHEFKNKIEALEKKEQPLKQSPQRPKAR